MLTDTKIKSLKAKAKPYKVGDSHGLYVYVSKTGSKLWRQKYRIGGKEKVLSYGEYPIVGLAEARKLRDQAREQISKDIDPSLTKKLEKDQSTNTFAAIARSWHLAQASYWSENHTQKVIISLEKDIFPSIGQIPINDITPPLLLQTIRLIEKRGAYEQSRRVTQRCDSVFRYAIASGLCTYNPAQDLQGALKRPQKRNYNSIEFKELPDFLKALDEVEAHPIIKLATHLLMLTFVRTGELRGAEWSEFDLENRVWEIPAERMKKKRTHLVPLSEGAMEVLERLKPYTGHRQYVFASPNKPKVPISNNAILQLIKRMGYAGKMTGHGFRHLASTKLNEMACNPDAIERQLGHIDGSVRGVYNKAELLEQRASLMQNWYEIALEHERVK